MNPFKNPIVVALDMDKGAEALELTKKLSAKVGGVKVGPRLALREGGEFLLELSRQAPVFLDCKFYDIPNTMEHSIRAAFECGVSVLTIHGMCGPEALQKMAQLERELSQKRPFKILSVTLLTSFNQENLPGLLNESAVPLEKGVMSIAAEVVESGLSSVVCSAHELSALKETFPNLYCVCPGIRLPEDALSDQKRVVTPGEAIKMGADALVVGRPIVDAKDPIMKAESFVSAVATS